MDHSTDDYSSDFESMKKVKHLVESDGDNHHTHQRSESEVWIKPKSERKSPTESNLFCGRLSVTTTHSGDGAASSSEMSPGSSSPSRSCTQCGATKTPLWRNGPCGPKSLCNACGIRYKKVGCTKRFNGGDGPEAPASQPAPAAKPSTKSPKRKAEEVSGATPTERTHHRKSKVVIREANTSFNNNNNNNHNISHPASNSNNSSSNNNNNMSLSNNNNNNNTKRERESSSAVEEKVASMVFRRVAVPRRVCTRRSLPAFHHQQQQQSQKWGSRSARLLHRKTQSKDEEEEGAALLMALACGLVNA